MPRLKRLLRETVASHSAGTDTGSAHHGADDVAADSDDLLDMTAEQLFSESLHSQKLLQIRKQAATICAAKPIRMTALLDSSNSPDSQFSAQRTAPRHNADMSFLEDCIELAVSVALEGQRVLFLVSNLPLISKLLAAALQRRHASTLSRTTSNGDLPLSEAFYAPLQRILLTQCRDVFQALCELSEVQRMWKKRGSKRGKRQDTLAFAATTTRETYERAFGEMEQSGARVAQQFPASASETHDDHEDFDLFGTTPMNISTVTTTTTTTTIAQVQPVNAEPSSPSNYELFPMAAADQTDMEREQVQALPIKEAPIQLARATAPAGEEKVADDGFELFPMAAVIKTLESSESAVTDTSEYSMYSGSASLTRSNSTPAVVSAATYAAATPLSPSHKVSGNAVDIIAVRNTEDQYFTTPWHVAFGWSRFRSNITTGVGDMVRVFVNGKELPTKMQLLERGRCAFVTGGLTPPVGDLNFTDLSEEHPNHVRFEHYQKSTDTFRYVESRLHVWGPNESVVVADLDGTLTISDVEGHIRTLRLGQYDFLHKGACDFFTKLHELDMKIVYLTARPIDWATASRAHLENAMQQSHSLPPGPLITNSNGLTGALFTEVVNKNPHVFKAHVLNEIQLTLIHAGRVVEHPVFVTGFGNRPTDIIAYENVGMDPSLIFMLDPYSNLKASSDPRIYESYSDPNALLWLLPRLKHRVPIEKVGRIDDYTVRELVLAEDREQLLMAERQARALQEEEYERARARGEGNVGGSSLTRVLYGSYNA